MTDATLCIRCGKKRIIAKQWSEGEGSAKTFHTMTVCPDPECQKIVDAELQRKQDIVNSRRIESEKRRKARMTGNEGKGFPPDEEEPEE